MDNIVVISGGFDPIHSGHVALIKDASKRGKVVVLLNSDNWLKNKKGKYFMPFSERYEIMLSIKNVIDVIEFDDKDKTCINGIKIVLEKYKNYKILFANGGDRNTETTPEKDFCIRNK